RDKMCKSSRCISTFERHWISFLLRYLGVFSSICSTSTSLENITSPRGRSNTDEEQTSSSMDHSENRSIEQSGGGRFQKSPQKSLQIHNLRSGRSQSAKSNTPANREQHKSPSVDPKEKGHTKKTFRCADCGGAFTFLSNLHRHMNSHVSACHPDRFPYSCTVCKKGLLSAKALETHMLGHARDKRPVCSECGHSFASQKSLNEHMRYHTGKYPLSCSVCNKGFMGRTALEEHMRSHTGERPFSCPECGEEFKLIAHYRNHMRIHSGEKPFSCPVCKRGFYRSTHVTSHMRVHRRQKPFNCKVCCKGFTRKERYRAHMKIHYVQEKYGVTSYGCFK
uniref:C2H2-type domain-containing protein n=1 Tax=Neogobius melanostomus TaxID=47308 RepID=A0A8C6WF66_9GOBI